jgi:endothelin-converting enzyme/putative endopeptidase
MRYFAMLLALCVAVAGAFAQEESPATPPKELPKLESFSTANTDASVNPCDDFFAFADGKWIAAHPIPADQANWGVDSPLELWNETLLVKTLDQASADDAKRVPNEQKVGDYYFACMDTKTINAHTAEWLKPELERIAAIKSKQGIADEVAHLHQTIPGAEEPGDNQTNAALLGYSGQPDYADASHNVATIDQGGMGLPGRSFYQDQDDKAKEIRAKYVQHVANIFVLAGEKPEQAKSDAATVLAIETQLAKGAMDPVARRDPKNLNNPMTLAGVKTLTPSFDWDAYLKLVNSPATPRYIVLSPDFFKNLELMLKAHSLEEWKTYLRWQVLHGSASGLSEAFVKENFDFYGRTLVGAQELQPRWRRCVQSVDGNLREALGEVYVKRAFPAEYKERVLQLVKDIEAALSKDIEAADWMAPETKKQAQLKLKVVLNKIGYPDSWRDYSSVAVGARELSAEPAACRRVRV